MCYALVNETTDLFWIAVGMIGMILGLVALNSSISQMVEAYNWEKEYEKAWEEIEEEVEYL